MDWTTGGEIDTINCKKKIQPSQLKYVLKMGSQFLWMQEIETDIEKEDQRIEYTVKRVAADYNQKREIKNEWWNVGLSLWIDDFST